MSSSLSLTLCLRQLRTAVTLCLLGMPAAMAADGVTPFHVLSVEQDSEIRPWAFIVLHHSATTSGSVEAIDREHRRRRDRSGNRWLGIGYHFVIGNGHGMEDGETSATFRWKQQLHGAHSGSLPHNDRGIGICLIGNFEDAPPTPAQRQAVTELVRELVIEFGIPPTRILGHSQVRATACPGRHFPLHKIVEEATGTRVGRDLFHHMISICSPPASFVDGETGLTNNTSSSRID